MNERVDTPLGTWMAHEAELRRLAVALTDSWDEAEDAVQDSFQHWMRAREGARRAGPLLRTILRRVVANAKRSAGRRRGREGFASERARARPERTSDPSEALARSETARRLSLALERLPNSERTVVRSRWFEGHSAAHIGRGLGVSAREVRELERGAFRRLRKDLGQQHVSPRTAFAALIGFAEGPRSAKAVASVQLSSTMAGGGAMVKFAAVGASLVALLALSWWLVILSAPEEGAPQRELSFSEGPQEEASAEPEASQALSALAAGPDSLPKAAPPRPLRAADLDLEARTGLVGRVEDEQGQPVPGATLLLQVSGRFRGLGSVLNAEGSPAHHPLTLRGRTATDGSFRLLGVPLESVGVLRCEHPQAGRRTLRLVERPAAAEVRDVGIIRLLRGRALQGRVVDLHGRPARGVEVREWPGPFDVRWLAARPLHRWAPQSLLVLRSVWAADADQAPGGAVDLRSAIRSFRFDLLSTGGRSDGAVERLVLRPTPALVALRDGFLGASATTDEEGRFTLHPAEAEAQPLVFTDPKGQVSLIGVRRTAALWRGEGPSFGLDAFRELELLVLDAEGRPRPGARVQAAVRQGFDEAVLVTGGVHSTDSEGCVHLVDRARSSRWHRWLVVLTRADGVEETHEVSGPGPHTLRERGTATLVVAPSAGVQLAAHSSDEAEELLWTLERGWPYGEVSALATSPTTGGRRQAASGAATVAFRELALGAWTLRLHYKEAPLLVQPLVLRQAGATVRLEPSIPHARPRTVVVEGADGRPVGGARVLVRSVGEEPGMQRLLSIDPVTRGRSSMVRSLGVTDASGRLGPVMLADGELALTVDHPEWVTRKVKRSLGPDEERIALRLEPPARLEILVYDKGQPLRSASHLEVVLEERTVIPFSIGMNRRVQAIDENGGARFSTVHPGELAIGLRRRTLEEGAPTMLWFEGAQPRAGWRGAEWLGQRNLVLEAGELSTVRFGLSGPEDLPAGESSGLAGRLDWRGPALVKARLSFQDLASSQMVGERSFAGGAFSFRSGAGRHGLYLRGQSGAGQLSLFTALELFEGRDVSWSAEVQAETLALRVLDAAGKPAPRAKVRIRGRVPLSADGQPNEGFRWTCEGDSDAQGWFRCALPAPSEATLSVEPPAGPRLSDVGVTMVLGRGTEHTVRLPDGEAVELVLPRAWQDRGPLGIEARHPSRLYPLAATPLPGRPGHYLLRASPGVSYRLRVRLAGGKQVVPTPESVTMPRQGAATPPPVRLLPR